MAHLSGDRRLKEVLDAGTDVFKAIAATWKRIDQEQVMHHVPIQNSSLSTSIDIAQWTPSKTLFLAR